MEKRKLVNFIIMLIIICAITPAQAQVQLVGDPEATAVEGTRVTVSCSFAAMMLPSEMGFCWAGEGDAKPTLDTNLGSTNEVSLQGMSFSAEITGLAPNTAFQVVSYAISQDGSYTSYSRKTAAFTTGEASNAAPTDITLDNNSLNEGKPEGTLVGTFTTEDSDEDDTHTYQLVSGDGDDNNTSFAIDGDRLETAEELTVGTYKIRVQTDDGNDNTFEKAFTITANEVTNPPPSVTFDPEDNDTDVPTNQQITITFSEAVRLISDDEITNNNADDLITLKENNASGSDVPFDATINTQKTVITIEPDTNLDAESVYYVAVEPVEGDADNATDAENITFETATGAAEPVLSVTPPSQIVSETTGLASFEVKNDGGTMAWTAVSGADWLVIAGGASGTNSGTISLIYKDNTGGERTGTITVTAPDAANSPVSVEVKQVAGSGGTDTLSVTPESREVAETMSMTTFEVENDGDGTMAWTAVSDDEWLIITSGDSGTNTGTITVVYESNPGAERTGTITVTAPDAENSPATVEVKQDGIVVTNQPPTDIALSSTNISEDQDIGTIVGILTTEDPDEGDTHTYSLVSGTGDEGNSSFSISSGNALLSKEVFDASVQDAHNIRVRATDKGDLHFDKEFTIYIDGEGVNRNPTNLTLSSDKIAEGLSIGTVVGTFTTYDPDESDTHTYSLVTGTGDFDNDSFNITNDMLKTAEIFNRQVQSVFYIRVQTDDGNDGRLEKEFTIYVTDEPEPPSDILLEGTTVGENQPAGTAVGTFTTVDTDGDDIHFYSLVSGDGDQDNAAFTIDDNVLRTADELDYETKNSLSILVQTNDNNGGTFQKSFIISVTDTNDPPADITLDNNIAGEFLSSGTLVGKFTADDRDSSDIHTFTLVSGEGSDGNGAFSIDGSSLLTNQLFDSRIKDTYTIRVRVADSYNTSFEKAFTITISSAPTITFYPENDARNVGLDENITITFSEPIRFINDSMITNTSVDKLITFTKGGPGGSNVIFDATINSTNKIITIDPYSSLESEQTYYVAVIADVEDYEDNPIEPASASFTTKDASPPVVTFIPADGAADVFPETKIRIIFSEPVRLIDNTEITDANVDDLIALRKDSSSGDDVSFSVTVNAQKTAITITPSELFSNSQTYYIALEGIIEDDSDNELKEMLEATFTVVSLFTDISAGVTGVARSSAVWGDYDRDGDLDILLSGYDYENSESVTEIWRNEKDKDKDTYEFYLSAGLTGVYFGDVAYGDYDNNGWPDILLSGYDGTNSVAAVYQNKQGTFQPLNIDLTGVHHSAAAWGDYNKDGKADILLTGYNDETSENVAKILRNNGNGSFTDSNAGLTGVYYASADWGDYDEDGDPDILMTGNDGLLKTAKVWRNDNGKFTDTDAVLPGVTSGSGEWGDYDNDGDLDILITGNDGVTQIARVYRNTRGNFTDINAGLTGVYQSDGKWGDFDNDGDPDILLIGDTGGEGINKIAKIYRNDNGEFIPVNSDLTGVSNGSADWGDYDDDGDLDILITGDDGVNKITRVYRNNLNGDPLPSEALRYAIAALKALVDRGTPAEYPIDDVDGDRKVGMGEALFYLVEAANER
ncbi:FG-GAP-like repeat-containing protein [Desulfococcaceae bacterium HSG8]|nr:FG-GAP-like repeat-containing protein [Desulfococcaceae bacterium HSG8]